MHLLGWRFFVGLQRDVTQDISVQEIIRAAGGSDEAYAALLASRAAAVQQHVCALGLHGDQAVESLQEKGMAAWVTSFYHQP